MCAYLRSSAAWAKLKRLAQYVEWTGVTIFLGFVTLGTALLRVYPTWFPLTMAIIGLFLVVLAAHNSYTQKSCALVEKYEERFFERMKSERESAAKFLLAESSSGDDLEDVLDYLESPIAEKVVSGAVDAKQIYNIFYHWIRLYWQAAEQFINDYRQQEEAAWTELRTLYERTSVFEKRRLKKKLNRIVTDEDLILKPERLRYYLLQEAGKKTSTTETE